jgi:hypothetical protein
MASDFNSLATPALLLAKLVNFLFQTLKFSLSLTLFPRFLTRLVYIYSSVCQLLIFKKYMYFGGSFDLYYLTIRYAIRIFFFRLSLLFLMYFIHNYLKTFKKFLASDNFLFFFWNPGWSTGKGYLIFFLQI